MKTLEDTHPSLCKDLMKNITKDWMMIENFPIDKIQKYTVDKSVLKDWLDGYFMKDLASTHELIRHLKQRFDLEETKNE